MAVAVFLSLVILPNPASAASSSGNWDGYLPDDSTVLNQTLSTYVVDDTSGVELMLVANLYSLQLASGNPNWEYGIAVSAIANTRRNILYEPTSSAYTCDPSNWYANNLPYSLTLGHNEGAWINSGGTPIWFFGAWFYRLWVTENGWVTFDKHAFNDNGGKWTDPNPPSFFPAWDDGKANGIIAPYWNDLNGGTIKYGHTGSGTNTWFDIAWIGPTDTAGKSQYFSLSIHTTPWISDRIYSEIVFYYCSITPNPNAWPRSGIEDLYGAKGKYGGIPSTQTWKHFDHGTSKQPSQPSWTAIAGIRVFADERYEDSSGSHVGDPDASIRIGGQYTLEPGGINVNLIPSTKGTYGQPSPDDTLSKLWKLYNAAVDLCSYIPPVPPLTTVSVVCSIAGIPATIADIKEAIDAFSVQKLEPTEKQETDFNDGLSSAYVRNTANEEFFADDGGWLWNNLAWDAGSSPLILWQIRNAETTTGRNVVHYLELRAEVVLQHYSCPSCSVTVSTVPLTIKLRPYLTPSGDVKRLAWFGRSSPDRGAYNFRPLSSSELPTGTTFGYHIDSVSQAPFEYKMIGWTPLTRYIDHDILLDSAGRLALKGHFKQSTTAGTTDLLVFAHYQRNGEEFNDDFTKVVKTAPILTSASGTAWVRIDSFTLDVGSAFANKRVKVAIGKTVPKDSGVVSVEWADVQFAQPFYLSISGFGGGSTSPAPGSHGFYPNSAATVTATAAPGYIFDHWSLDGVTSTANPISITMGSSRTLSAYFFDASSKSLTITVNDMSQGSTNPVPGTYTYPYGTVVTVVANPSGCSYLKWWFLDGSRRFEDPIDVTMDQNHTLSAVFATPPGGC